MMIKAAIGFFILALLSIFFGLSGVAGLSMEIAQTLLTVFVILAVLSYLLGIAPPKRTISNKSKESHL